MKNIKILIALVFLSMTVSSCWWDKTKPNVQYMPNMYSSEAYEPYAKAERYSGDNMTNKVEAFKDGQTALLPPDNVVPKTDGDILPDEIPNTPEGYEFSKTVTTSPLNPAERVQDLEKGKKAYELTCAVCHGTAGDGQGPISKNGKFNGVPAYGQRAYLSVGSVHWVIMNGRNMMGSHASQLTAKERWQVAEYVMTLKNQQLPQQAPATTSTATATPTK